MGRDNDTLVLPGDNTPQSQESFMGALSPGMVAGDYILGELIAEGGCGAVYHARHRTHSHRVALKVLHANLSSQPKMVQRFTREVKLVSLLRHPNIAEVEAIGVLPGGRPFFAMEYLAGKTLD